MWQPIEPGESWMRSQGYIDSAGTFKHYPYPRDNFQYGGWHSGATARVDEVHSWATFTMYWPAIAIYALVGKE